ncbi:dioxygenase [Massilia sp. PAMC28688]|uniref:DODA-type extradiol aromatic ring-opening family dioxygenase n=1 Tax=Massilia sp. PAMC28688 TaxID=2861283 RepID=UPI001C629F9D|nr:class III extradiol ring-cleavage dioxygenase [Massilia sp. PAMC28688]QYF93547.1 dioxygenase [Massilia sp. PAMC28688]
MDSSARTTMPVYFLSHGGGPWPFVDGMREQFALTERALRELPQRLPRKPSAILVITGHWEEDELAVSAAERPGMEYDYTGFPAHTYHITYPAPGSPALAARVQALLAQAGFPVRADSKRGFDHGTFVPVGLMYPDADVPVVMLSLQSSYDPREHIRIGQALQPLREEGVLIIGSGLTYHNMRGFGRDDSGAVADAFERFLSHAIEQEAGTRNRLLEQWEQAPHARAAHPREDHLLPLMVVAGAAGSDPGRTVFRDHAMKVPMASYEFGHAQVA